MKLSGWEKKVFLCGYMGSGKTTVASALGALLKKPWVDLDAIIEKEESIRISSFYIAYGEAEFRILENKYLRELCTGNVPIIALGGGTLEDPKNIDTIQKNGYIVFLKPSTKTLIHRLEKEKEMRPVLVGKNPLDQFISSHYALRLPQYKQADFTIRTEGLSPRSIALIISNWLAEKPEED
jgi:shikimate kinase